MTEPWLDEVAATSSAATRTAGPTGRRLKTALARTPFSHRMSSGKTNCHCLIYQPKVWWSSGILPLDHPSLVRISARGPPYSVFLRGGRPHCEYSTNKVKQTLSSLGCKKKNQLSVTVLVKLYRILYKKDVTDLAGLSHCRSFHHTLFATYPAQS